MAKKKKYKKSEKKGKKSDMSAATSASSLDDTLNTSDNLTQANEGAEHPPVVIGVYKVDRTLQMFFPEMTSDLLRARLRTVQQQVTYNKLQEHIDSLGRQGYPLALFSFTFILAAIGFLYEISQKEGGDEDVIDLYEVPDLVQANTAWIINPLNGVLKLDPSYALYHSIDSWMGLVSAAFFTFVLLRISIVLTRSAKRHERDVSCYVYCVYLAVPVMILIVGVCLTAVWAHKLIQLCNYYSSYPCVTIKNFISWKVTCQSAFEYTTVALLALHRLTIFIHRYYCGVHYASKFGVSIDSWSQVTLLFIASEFLLTITLLKFFKCYLLISFLLTFLDDILVMVESCKSRLG